MQDMEIERQFLVRKLPKLPATFDYIEQGYIALAPEYEERIRAVNHRQFIRTVKRGAGLMRQEQETAISHDEFERLKANLSPGTCIIEKRRYYIFLPGGETAELNLHEGALKGFNYVEVEFPSRKAAKAFTPPDWFGREVTYDKRFSYGRLARPDGRKIVQEILA